MYAPSFMAGPPQEGTAGLSVADDDGIEDPQVVQAVGHVGAGRQRADPGDLVEESAGLVDEEVVLPVSDGREVHRQAAAPAYGCQGPTNTVRAPLTAMAGARRRW